MGAQENIKLVEDMRAAAQSRDEQRYLSFWADDSISRTAGASGAGRRDSREGREARELPQPSARLVRRGCRPSLPMTSTFAWWIG